MRMILAADFGGTKSVVAVFAEHQFEQPLQHAEYVTRQFASPLIILQDFLKAQAIDQKSIVCAGLGFAGPVSDTQANITNLNLTISRKHLTDFLQFPIFWMNDLVAQAYGALCPHVTRHSLVLGQRYQYGSAAIIAPGTGLGEAIMARTPNGLLPLGGEGGHADFAAQNDWQWQFQRFCAREYGPHVSCERVISGAFGLPNLYRFVNQQHGMQAQIAVNDLQFNARLSQAAHQGDAIASEVFAKFFELLGAEAGNLALKCNATFGVYLSGGIITKNLQLLESSPFVQAFCAKGRFATFMETVPVVALTDPMAGLKGAAFGAAHRLDAIPGSKLL